MRKLICDYCGGEIHKTKEIAVSIIIQKYPQLTGSTISYSGMPIDFDLHEKCLKFLFSNIGFEKYEEKGSVKCNE